MNFFGIEVGVNCNASGFKTGLDTCTKLLKGFGSSVAGNMLGADALKGLAASLWENLKQQLAKPREIKLGKIKTGLDSETFQTVASALEASGSSADALATGLAKIATAMEAVRLGGAEGEKAQMAFAALGITVGDLNTKTRQQVFFQMAEGLQAAARAGRITEQQMSALREVLGKSAVEFIPFFERGMGRVVDSMSNKSEEALEKLGKINRTVGEMKKLYELGEDLATEKLLDAWEGAAALPVVGPAIGTAKIAKEYVFGSDSEREEQEKGLADAAERAAERKAKIAGDAASQTAGLNQEQRNREAIAQLDAEKEDHLAKSMTDEEKLARIQQRRLEIQKAMGELHHVEGFVGADDVKKARLEASLAELDAEEFGIEKKGKHDRQPHALKLTSLQQIGAQINTPKSRDPTPDIVRNTARANEILSRVAGGVARVESAIRQKASTFED